MNLIKNAYKLNYLLISSFFGGGIGFWICVDPVSFCSVMEWPDACFPGIVCGGTCVLGGDDFVAGCGFVAVGGFLVAIGGFVVTFGSSSWSSFDLITVSLDGITWLSGIVSGWCGSGVFSLIEFLLNEERRTIPDLLSSGSWNVDRVVLIASDLDASPSNVYYYYNDSPLFGRHFI